MGYNPANGQLYGSDISSNLFTINIATGARTLIGFINGPNDNRGLAFVSGACPSPTPTPTPTGSPSCTPSLTMYGSNGNGALNRGALVTINQTNGSGTVVGTPVAGVGLPGLAFHPDGRLFASTVTNGNPSTLIQINPDTGALIATIGTINDNGTPLSIGDLSFQPGTGVLYGITSNTFSPGGMLYTINLTTAAATFIGDAIRCRRRHRFCSQWHALSNLLQ